MNLLDSRPTSSTGPFETQNRVARVNLLPPEVITAREFRRTQKWLAAAVLAVLVALIGVYLVQVRDRDAAAAALAAERTTTSTLQRQQAVYAYVPRAYAVIDQAQTARATAMAQDVDWARYMSDLSVALPPGVWLTSLDMHLLEAPNATPGAPVAPGTAPASPGTAPASGLGALVFAGSALNHPDVGALLVSLGKQRALTNPYFSSSKEDRIGGRTVVTFSSAAGVSAAALTHRFDRKAG